MEMGSGSKNGSVDRTVMEKGMGWGRAGKWE